MISVSTYRHQIVGRVLPQSFSIISQIIFLRDSDIANFSQFWLLITFWTILFTSVAGGVDVVYQNRAKLSELPAAFCYKLFFGVFFSVLCYFLFQILGLDVESVSVILVFFALCFQAILSLIIVAFRVENRDEFILWPKLIQALVLVVLCIFFDVSSLLSYAIVYFISWFVAIFLAITLLLQIKSIGLLQFNLNADYFKLNMIRGLLSVGFSALVFQVYINIDFLVLSNFYDPDVSGLFRLDFFLSSAIIPLVSAINVIYLSKLSQGASGKSLWISFYYNSLLLLGLFSLFSFFVFIFYDFILTKLLGKNLADESSFYIYLIIAGYFLNSIATMFSYLLIHGKYFGLIFKLNVILFVCCPLISLSLVSHYGLAGAYWSFFSLNTFVFALFFIYFLLSQRFLEKKSFVSS